MSLLKDERVEIILLCGRGWSHERVAIEFSRLHPDREPIHQTSVTRLLAKFKETGSVLDKPKTGRNPVPRDETEQILNNIRNEPRKSLRRLSNECGRDVKTVHKILRKNKFKPYKFKILHHMHDGDFERRSEMSYWFMWQLNENPEFLKSVLFTDEANFYTNGVVNKQQSRYWAQENPHVFLDRNEQGAARLMVWLGGWDETLIGPFFFDGTVTGQTYLKMLGDEMFPQLHALGGPPEWFQHDGAPPHFAGQVRVFLDEQFPDRWIGRGGPVPWAPRSPDLNPLDFSIWGLLKDRVYRDNIRDVGHLRQKIVEECANFERRFLRNIIGSLERRVTLCFNEGGGHIEHLL